MFRLTQFLHGIRDNTPISPRRSPKGPVVIWNLTRRCNLLCKHCYTVSSDRAYAGELNTAQAKAVMADLRAADVPVLILSGGEPLARPDIFELSEFARDLGFYVALSTNGTQIDESNVDRIAAMGYDYVGISLDGKQDLHDKFRGEQGAFAASLHAIRLCVARGLKVGIRYTLTQLNKQDFPDLLQLMRDEGIHKFYLSHLNYGGRGNVNRGSDAYFETTRQALDLMFDSAWRDVRDGADREYVTGNNDADGVYLLHWVAKHLPQALEATQARLRAWGGNASGVNVANIDNLGNVHPDTFWWEENLGNVLERPFGGIWRNPEHALLLGLQQRPRPVKDRCAACRHLDICNGNSRVRAKQITGDVWAADPGCYLTDAEIGVDMLGRESVRPFSPRDHAGDARYLQTFAAK